MPSIEDLKQFNQQLIQTGEEDRIKAERGEEVEILDPPSPEQAQALASRNRLRVRKNPNAPETGAADSSGKAESSEDREPSATPEGEENPSMDDFLSSTLGGGEDQASEDGGQSPDFDFGDLFASDDGGSESDELDLDALGLTDAPEQADSPGEDEQSLLDDFLNDFAPQEDEDLEEAPSQDENFFDQGDEIPGGRVEPGGQSTEPGEQFSEPGEATEPPDQQTEPDQPSAETGFPDFTDLETGPEPDTDIDFGAGTEGEAGTEIPDFADLEEGSAPDSDDGFDIPDFADLDMDTEGAATPPDFSDQEALEDLGTGESSEESEFSIPEDLASQEDLDSGLDVGGPDDGFDFGSDADLDFSGADFEADLDSLEADMPTEDDAEQGAPPQEIGEPAPSEDDLDSFGDLDEPSELPDDLADLDDFAESPDDLEDLSDLADLEESPEPPDDLADLSDLDQDDQTPETAGDLDDLSDLADLDQAGFGTDDFTADDFGSDDFGNGDFGAADFGESEGPGELGEPGEASLDDSFAQESPQEPPDFDDAFGAEGFGGDEEFSDEFSMGDFGAEFGILDDEQSLLGDEEVSVPGEQPLPDEELGMATSSDEAQGFGISDDEFGALKSTLAVLPLNLKLATAEALTKQDLPFEGQKALIQALVAGESAKKIAAHVNKLTGRRIQVPRGYEKKTGEEFAREQQTFAYQFREKIWPVIRISALITLAVGFLGFVGYRYVYEPLYAASLYDQGIQNIQADQYPRANLLFGRAFTIWPDEGRFLQYAQEFSGKRQYSLAQEKYRQAIEYNPENRTAILEYADFAAYTLRDYQESIDTLSILLNKSKNDFDPLLAYGDVYMEWARYTREPQPKEERYDEARFAYVRLTNVYGQTDQLLYRLMLYFIRTDNLPGAFELHKVFALDPRASVNPRIYAELGGFYVDRHLSGERNPFEGREISTEERLLLTLPDLLEEAQEVLQAAIEQDPRIPEAHYNLSRVFAEQGKYDLELQALNSAETLFSQTRENRPLNQFEAAQEIDTHTRLGVSYQRTGNNLSAEQYYRQAAALYERARDNAWVQPAHDYGKIYANLGDLYYYQGNDYPAALQFFLQARQNGFGQSELPEMTLLRRDLSYKIGYIYYLQEEFTDALDYFNQAEGSTLTRNNNLLYAKANTYYQQGNYPAAVAHYRILANRLVQERDRISTFLVQEDSTHRGLIDFTIRTYNNLGAALHHLALMAGPQRGQHQVEAQYYFSKATELSENLNRDLDTAVRADTRSVAYLNLRSVLVPGFEDQVLLDPDLRKDLQAEVF
ncbi:periplasmic flagellar collar protein FlcA [Spirochaeta lutea]|uniref:Tetratricopeptide repeat protein n=1 Tax=Spirochaeta lutea TaxID=1480694 RepID=A0A098QVM3_9SPIO|nr:tetratricopeptide repeat protein [Spirochaeta lutea]KGE71631.1 hypothetical protein DC28_10190 [Spirochaeta lutea]